MDNTREQQIYDIMRSNNRRKNCIDGQWFGLKEVDKGEWDDDTRLRLVDVGRS